MPTLGVMYGIGAASPSEIVAALPPGWSVCWLVDQEDAASAPLRSLLGHSGPVHYWRDFLAARVPGQLGAVTTFCDPMVLPAALVRQRLGLRGTSAEAARLLTDKFLQRQRLASSGLDQTPCLSAAGPDGLSSAADSVGLPAVIKPRTSVGSAYTFRVCAKDELDRVAADIPAAVWAGGGVVVEPELPGRGLSDVGLADYVSVETLSTGGRHRPVAVTARLALAPPFRERGGVMPAGLGQADLRRVTELAVAALDAIGVSDGVSHVEIKLRADGADLIEVNGRLGGHIAWLWKRTGGGDLVGLEMAAACQHDAEWPEPGRDVVAFRYLLPAPMTVGRVSAVSGVAQVRELPGVELVQLRARRGTVVDWRQGTGSYVVLVSGATPTFEDMHRCIGQIESLVRVELDETGEAGSADEKRA
jgi:biotin carboxylase